MRFKGWRFKLQTGDGLAVKLSTANGTLALSPNGSRARWGHVPPSSWTCSHICTKGDFFFQRVFTIHSRLHQSWSSARSSKAFTIFYILLLQKNIQKCRNICCIKQETLTLTPNPVHGWSCCGRGYLGAARPGCIQERNTWTARTTYWRQTGHSFILLPHLVQVIMWPHSSRTQSMGESMQTLQRFSSTPAREPSAPSPADELIRNEFCWSRCFDEKYSFQTDCSSHTSVILSGNRGITVAASASHHSTCTEEDLWEKDEEKWNSPKALAAFSAGRETHFSLAWIEFWKIVTRQTSSSTPKLCGSIPHSLGPATGAVLIRYWPRSFCWSWYSRLTLSISSHFSQQPV